MPVLKSRKNGELRGTPRVRVVDADNQPLGVMTIAEALRAAMKAGLDLIEVNPKANPPVCKLDLSKYRYAAVRAAHKEESDDDD